MREATVRKERVDASSGHEIDKIVNCEGDAGKVDGEFDEVNKKTVQFCNSFRRRNKEPVPCFMN